MSDTGQPPPVDGARWIALTRGRFALVDAADYDALSAHRWHFDGYYASRRGPEFAPGRSEHIYMHRAIVGAPADLEVDHRNADKLDNRRGNLRLASRRQNVVNAGKSRRNTSGFKGVSWHAQRGRWRASIRANGRQVHLGLFDDPAAAARAYDSAAMVHHGEFARLNFRSTAATENAHE